MSKFRLMFYELPCSFLIREGTHLECFCENPPPPWTASLSPGNRVNNPMLNSSHETQCRVLVDSNPDAMTIHCTMCTLFHTNSAGLSKLGHILKNPKRYFYEHIFSPAENGDF